MEASKEYTKTCPYDGKIFVANHLNRMYCTERCKRRMFRKKLQENRKGKILCLKNDTLVGDLHAKGIIKISKKELIDLGFDEKAYITKFIFKGILLILLKNFYLAAESDTEFIIYPLPNE